MSRQYFNETVSWAVTSGAAIASTTAETIIFPDVSIPGGFMFDGRALRLRAIGQYSNTGTPTLIFTVRWGGVAGTILCKTAACTTPSGVTAAMWDLDVIIQTRTSGSSGTVMANGRACVFAAVAGTVSVAAGDALVTPMTNGGVGTPAAVTLDLTATANLSLTATWSASSASNTLTGLSYTIEALN
jgi:hypothetical protein